MDDQSFAIHRERSERDLDLRFFSFLVFGLFALGFSGRELYTRVEHWRELKNSALRNSEQNRLALLGSLRPEITRLFSFGQLPVVIDLLWLKGLQDDRVTPKMEWPAGVHPGVYADFDLATSLDPAFFEGYLAGGSFLSIIRNDARGGVALIEKGNAWRKSVLPRWPESVRQGAWRDEAELPTALIYHYLFPLRDLKKAIEAIDEADRIPGAPAYVHGLKARLGRPIGIYEIGENLIQSLINRESNPLARATLVETSRHLRVAKFIKQANVDWKKTRRLKGSHDPWGGLLTINARNEVVTSTPYEPVFGLNGLEDTL